MARDEFSFLGTQDKAVFLSSPLSFFTLKNQTKPALALSSQPQATLLKTK